jgi:hypothetical protein
MKPRIVVPAAVFIVVCLMVSAGQAQVVREDGVKSIAGFLVPSSQETAEWTFASAGGAILFASLDAEIYRDPMSGTDHETGGIGDTGGCADTSGGCADTGDGCSGGSSGECSGEGGPGLFFIEVIGPTGVICHVERPAPPPGWMRDPRMACKLPVTSGQTPYTLRVGLKVPHGERVQEYHAFLLNVSLRRIAPTGVNIQAAIALSGNNGF